MVVDEAGNHFDPAVVEAFLECEPEILEISRQFRDEQVLTAQNCSLEKHGAPVECGSLS
jgi:hypothetical protein